MRNYKRVTLIRVNLISVALSAAAADSFRAVISQAIPDIPGRISLVTVHENKRWLAALSAVR